MKTAAKLLQIWSSTSKYKTTPQFIEWIEMIQSDARAGMVPEGDCIQPVYTMDEDGKEHEAPCECCERRGKPSGQHEAELAKAWEAGWSAHGTAIGTGTAFLIDGKLMIDLDWAQALQPPGGKAK